MDSAFTSVIGASVLIFDDDIEPAQRKAVSLAVRFAYRATQDLYKEQGGQWYDYYRRQLRFLGWDAQPPSHVYAPDTRRVSITDHACKQVAAQGLRFGELAARGLDKLKGSPQGTALLEHYAREHHHGMYQLLPCTARRGAAGARLLDLLVYHEELDLHATGNTLFGATSAPLITVHIGLARFDVGSFQRAHMPAIAKRFEKLRGDYLALL
ncbi:hypothetical protein [Pseudomonas typographi]|uniref:Uncharacterized protein n=1 Tax=Pseudomonas typographi TaxID=2715964 RepID=A0ABR7Z878_9PSED|nr:hypothetical protein [Pseudomonas typographi]MBD1554334.1 hypothetical protein [Pseudomonas typographi]MBD1589398.1 hypothetical protein [Pseudomonas typographi]MBD1601523.1 hypothetical protein [Pseudomonas typographi]